MARRYRRKGKKGSLLEDLDWSVEPDTARSVTAVILIILGIIILLGLFGLAGAFGGFFLRLSTDIWGILGYLVPFIFLVVGVILLLNREELKIKPMMMVGIILAMIFLPALIHPLGGAIGSGVHSLFQSLVGFYASLILLFGLTIVSILLIFNTSIVKLWNRFKMGGDGGIHVNEGGRASVYTTLQSRQMAGSMVKPFADGKPWNFPPIDLLEAGSGKATSGNISKNVEIIQKTLADFSITVSMGDVNVGPTVTQYTLKPAPSVKLNQNQPQIGRRILIKQR